jgi:hypothetical protein
MGWTIHLLGPTVTRFYDRPAQRFTDSRPVTLTATVRSVAAIIVSTTVLFYALSVWNAFV